MSTNTIPMPPHEMVMWTGKKKDRRITPKNNAHAAWIMRERYWQAYRLTGDMETKLSLLAHIVRCGLIEYQGVAEGRKMKFAAFKKELQKAIDRL